MYKIEKDVPVPDRYASRRKYPFSDMKKGDSFLVPHPEKGTEKTKKILRQQIINAFFEYKKTNGLTKKDYGITTHITPQGIRCWRVN